MTHTCPYRKHTGFTLVEIMATLAIILFFMSIAWYQLAPTTRRSEMLNNLRYTRAALIRARSAAIEYTQPVRFTLDAGNAIRIERDPTRDGDWTDAILVQGNGNNGDASPYTKISVVRQASVGRALPHWTRLASLGNVTEFPSTAIILLPDGNVWAGSPLAPSGGTWFFEDDRSHYFGAVHMTAMGEIKMAYIRGDEARGGSGGDYNGWFWID